MKSKILESLNISKTPAPKSDGSTLLAPNGKPSNLTPKQWHLVRTPEFISWFGDWINSPETASKVVDENGEPLVVYHGSRNSFYEFSENYIGSSSPLKDKKGFFFISEKEEAKEYGDVIAVFLSIKSPLVDETKDKYWTSAIYYWDMRKNQYLEDSKNKDGVIVLSSASNIFVAFAPTQIKLADGTNTTFDSGNPDIRFDSGGAVDSDVSLSKTPAPKSDRVYGSKTNAPKSAESANKAKEIQLSDSIVLSIENKLKEHNHKNADKKISLAVGKAVVRRGMGAYSATHRPTISGGSPNSRVAWGLARLNAFIYKAEHGKSKSGKYHQDDDLLNDLEIKHKNYEDGGQVDNDEIYKKWKNLINMSASELHKFYLSEEGKEAGLSANEAKSLGIHSGRESARWVMKMKNTPRAEWTPEMWEWAKRQIGFVSRMRGNSGALFDKDGNKTRKHTSLLIWGHNPVKSERFNSGGAVASSGTIDLLHTGSDTTAFESASPDIIVEGDVVINHDPQVDSFKVDSWEKGGEINSLIESIKNKLVEDNGNDDWEEFVDGQSLGECQSIAHAIKCDFPQVKSVFGEIEVDEEYTDEDGEQQTIMTHHWIEVNGQILDFSKGTTQNYINWHDIYDPSADGEEWRYRAIREYEDGGLIDDIYTHEKIKKGFVSFRIKYESGRSLKEQKSSIKSIDEAPFKELAGLKMKGIDGISSSNYNISEWLVHRECMIVMPFQKLRELNELEQIKYFDADYLMSNGMEAMFRLYARTERTDRDYYSVLQTVFPKIAQEFMYEADVKTAPSVVSKFYSLKDIYDVYQSSKFVDYMSKQKRINSPEDMAKITVDYILSGQMKADNYYVRIPEELTVEEIIEPIKRGIIYSGSVYREESEWRVKNKELIIPDGSQLFFVLSGYENMKEEYEKLIAKYDLRKHYTVNYIPYERLNEFQMQRFNMQRERGAKEFEEAKLEVDKKIGAALEHTRLEILEDVEPQIKAEINESAGSENFSNEDGMRYGADIFSVPEFKSLYDQIIFKFNELFEAEASNVVKNKNKYYVESAIRAFNVYLEDLEAKLGGKDSGIMDNWGKKIFFYDFIHPITRIFRNLNYMPYLDKIKEKVGSDLFKYYDRKTTMMARGGVIQKGSSKKSIEQNKQVGQKMLSDEALKHETSESLLRSGGFSNDALDLAAFGFTEETVKTIMPDELTIKWKDDFDNVTYQQEKSGLSKEAWAKKIDLSEPIDVSFDGEKFNIEDGHHRYYAAKILNKPLKVNLEIKANPIVALSELEYDEFHRNYFDKVKTTTMEKGGTVYEGETEPSKKRNDTWYKQSVWKGNPSVKIFSDDVIFNKKMATGGEVKKKEEKLGTALYFLEREKMFSIRSASKEMKKIGKNWRVTKINFNENDEDLGLFSDADIIKLARDNGFEKLQMSDLENLIISEAGKCGKLECDGAVRVFDFILTKNNIPHYVFQGIVRLGEKDIPLHLWIGLPDGRIVDFKAQMWLGKDAPNGIFFPADTKAIYDGKVIEMNTDEMVYRILTQEI